MSPHTEKEEQAPITLLRQWKEGREGGGRELPGQWAATTKSPEQCLLNIHHAMIHEHMEHTVTPTWSNLHASTNETKAHTVQGVPTEANACSLQWLSCKLQVDKTQPSTACTLMIAKWRLFSGASKEHSSNFEESSWGSCSTTHVSANMVTQPSLIRLGIRLAESRCWAHHGDCWGYQYNCIFFPCN